MKYLFLFHVNNGYANAHHCYVYAYCTMPVLLPQRSGVVDSGFTVQIVSVSVQTLTDPYFHYLRRTDE